MSSLVLAITNRPASPEPPSALRRAAEELEANFLAEMLKSAGVGKPPEGFSGGIGEDQFGSFQRQALAGQMVRSGGIGLAETFFEAMLENRNDG